MEDTPIDPNKVNGTNVDFSMKRYLYGGLKTRVRLPGTGSAPKANHPWNKRGDRTWSRRCNKLRQVELDLDALLDEMDLEDREYPGYAPEGGDLLSDLDSF